MDKRERIRERIEIMPKPMTKQPSTVKDAAERPVKRPAVNGIGKNTNKQDGNEAQEVSVDQLRERRYLWTARAFAIVSVVALCVNLVLLLAIVHLMPLKRVEPFLLTFQSRDEQVVKIRPLSKDMGAEDIISEAMIRQYVLLRNTMISDVDEMAFR